MSYMNNSSHKWMDIPFLLCIENYSNSKLLMLRINIELIAEGKRHQFSICNTAKNNKSVCKGLIRWVKGNHSVIFEESRLFSLKTKEEQTRSQAESL